MMDREAWGLFLEAAELGSLSKVATVRGTSQPHISRQISELESRCGGRLFARTGRGVALTEFGQRIAPGIRAWLNSTAQLENDILSSAAKPLGRVRLGILPSLAHPYTGALYKRLRDRYPLIQLQVREGQGAQLETWLEEGSLDLAFVFRHGPPDDRDALALAETQTYLVSATGDPLTKRESIRFAELDKLPLVTFCRPSRWRDLLDQLASQRDVRLNVVLEADSLALQFSIVASGGAYALLGLYAIQEGLAGQRIQATRMEAPQISRHIAMALARTGELTAAIRAVMDEARALAREMDSMFHAHQFKRG
jgi:LysR family nitrogen assimilation transcriptional regulator